MGFQVASVSAGELDCFTEWVATRYRALADGMDGFDIIRWHVAGDERRAYEGFFRLLPEYLCERQTFGIDDIRLRFSEVQDELLESFNKTKEK